MVQRLVLKIADGGRNHTRGEQACSAWHGAGCAGLWWVRRGTQALRVLWEGSDLGCAVVPV